MDLGNSEVVLDLFEAPAFGFGHHEFHPDELEDHHAAEEEEDVACRESRDHRRE